MAFICLLQVCSSTFITTPWGLWIELCEWSESKKDAKVMKPGPPAATSSHVVDAAGGGDNHAGAVGHPDVGRSIFEVRIHTSSVSRLAAIGLSPGVSWAALLLTDVH